MRTINTMKRAALTAIALAVFAGGIGATAAEVQAQDRAQAGGDRNKSPRQERVIKNRGKSENRRNDRAVRSRDNGNRGDRRHDDRAVRDRDRDHRDRGRDDRAYRDHDRRGDRRDHRPRIVIRDRHARYCPPPRVVVRPWYRDVRRMYVRDDPFYFHAGLGIFLGGLALHFELGDVPPEGYIYYDPYCDETFWSVAEYHQHLRWHRHPAALSLIMIDGYWLDY